ncbi:MAG: hypothetical protein ABI599_03180 [Flavobacteriales bacterium]
MHRLSFLLCLLLSSAAYGQLAPAGVPLGEGVDVTGDGIADLVFNGETQHMDDPEMGQGGFNRVWLEPLPGTVFLFRCTPNRSDFYRVEEGSTLSADAVSAGLRFLQLCWSRPEDEIRIGLLEKGFGFRGVDTTSWYGSDHFKEGTLVVRSATGKQAALAAFTIDLDVVADRVGFTLKASLPVDAHFGEFEPIVKPFTSEDSLHSAYFGRKLIAEPIVPAGITPDERIDLVTNDTADVVLTGYIAYTDSSHKSGWYRRGVSPLPGTAFLMERQADRSYRPFRLALGQTLTPTRLEMGLHSGSLRWADPLAEPVFILVLEQAFGLPAPEVEGWSVPENFSDDDLVFRSNEYGRPMLGSFEIGCSSSGKLWINQQEQVDAGQPLEAR